MIKIVKSVKKKRDSIILDGAVKNKKYNTLL